MNLYLAFAAAAVIALLGVLHLIYTLHDFGARPRYFQPRDAQLLDAMRQTRAAIARGGRDYWSTVLGFNLSHSLGLSMFALLICLATVDQIGWLKPVLVAIGLAYAAIAYRCWFRIPMVGALLAVALMLAGWLL